MNRLERRAAAAKARDVLQRNAERIRNLVDERESLRNTGEQFRMLLFAAARAEGRLLIRHADLVALGEDDRIDFVERENGDVVVEYRSGSAESKRA